jgi:uncharacterized protein YndB with AHSA1/START domain
MVVKESIVIDAPPSKVWEYIGSPDLWSLFHAKVGKCEQVSLQGGRMGSIYSIEFRLGEETTATRCEIVDLRPGEMIQIQSQSDDPNNQAASATLTYELEDLGTRTKVREQITFALAEVGVVWRAIIWFVNRFGSCVGDSTLVRLKRVVEEG